MKHSQGALADISLRIRSDNKGNTFAVRKQYAKKWPNSGLMMELASLQHASGIEVNLRHVKRCSNVWADRLAALDSSGFCRNKQRPSLESVSDWIVLQTLLDTQS